MRGQKRLRRTVGARSGDYSERVALLNTERFGLIGLVAIALPILKRLYRRSRPHKSAGSQIVERCDARGSYATLSI